MDEWRLKSDLPGRLRAVHPFIRRHPAVAARLGAVLTNVGGVSRHSVNVATSNVLVYYDAAFISRDDLLELLATELEREVTGAGPDGPAVGPVPLDLLPVRIVLSSLMLGLAAASYFAAPLAALALAGTAVAALPIVTSAARSLAVERRLRVDALDTVVVVLALAYRRVLPAAFMVWVVDVSYVLLDASSRASRRRLASVFGRRAHKTRLLTAAGVEVDWRVDELRVDDVVVVRSGEPVPIDGVVIDGDGAVDQAALTGEYAPVERVAGESVYAMSVLLSGSLRVRAVRTGADTSAARMSQLIQESFEHRVRVLSTAERFADDMVVPTFALGGLAYGLTGPNAMLAVINADYGTGIRVAGPLAMLASLQAGARHAILVKKGHALETLCELGAVVFDKTGTLTTEVPVVRALTPIAGDFDAEALLALVATVEQRFTHPIARAILREAAARGLRLPAAPEVDYRLGLGIHVERDGQVLRVGSRRFMEQESVGLEGDVRRRLEAIDERGGTAVLAALETRVVGLIELAAAPRPEARQIVHLLRERRNIDEIHLVSGDHEAPTRALAEQLGIERYRAEVAPSDKAAYVRDLQARGLKVAMVGDGINDTVGLAQADCSISLRGAADAAVDIADVVFLDGNLARFEVLFDIADNLHHNVRNSFALVLVPNSVCIGGAILGYFGLGASLIFNNVFNLAAVANGLRAQNGLRPTLLTDGPRAQA